MKQDHIAATFEMSGVARLHVIERYFAPATGLPGQKILLRGLSELRRAIRGARIEGDQLRFRHADGSWRPLPDLHNLEQLLMKYGSDVTTEAEVSGGGDGVGASWRLSCIFGFEVRRGPQETFAGVELELWCGRNRPRRASFRVIEFKAYFSFCNLSPRSIPVILHELGRVRGLRLHVTVN